MKVTHAAKFYPPAHGGMETVIADLCDGTADVWDVQVVAASDSPQTVRERRGGSPATLGNVAVAVVRKEDNVEAARDLGRIEIPFNDRRTQATRVQRAPRSRDHLTVLES